MRILTKVFSVAAGILLLSSGASAQYFCISENYETEGTHLFESSINEIVDGDGVNTSRFINPGVNASGQYRLGFKTMDRELNGVVTVDFRAKAVDGQNYFSFDTRQNSDYMKTLNVSFSDVSIIKKWRYYRIVADFSNQTVSVYSSESGFDSLGDMDNAVYNATFTDATGFNVFRFINCKLDDVAVYSGGNAPYVKSAEIKKYGGRLIAEYELADVENDSEGRSGIYWEKSDDGVNFTQISGEYDKCYTLNRYDIGRYIRAKIQPVSTAYPTTGQVFYTEAVKITNVSDYTLADSSGKEVFEIANGNYSLAARLNNGQEFMAILAVYNQNGTLNSAYTKTGADISIDNINLSDISSGAYHKVFFFDALGGLEPVYDKDEQLEQYFKEVLDDIELTGKIKTLYDKGNYIGAFKEYRCDFFKNIENKKDMLDSVAVSGNLRHADDLYNNNNITITNDSAEYVTFHLGDEGAYNWIYPDITYMQYGTRMGWTECLIKAYQYTGDEKYLKKWLTIWEDFDANFYNQYDEYRKENGTYFDGYNIGFLKVEQLNVGMRASNRIKGLFSMPIDRYIDDETLAKMIISQVRDAVSISLNQETPNHFLYGYTAILRAAEIFDTKKFRAHLSEYEEAMGEFVDSNYAIDGGETEMSLHYNYDMFSYYDNIKDVYDTKQEKPEWYEKLDLIAKNKLRLLTSVVTPTGHNPSLAHDYIAEDAFERLRTSMKYFGTDTVAETVYNTLTGTSETEPAFASIAFPYTGYYVMRTGWKKNSDYLFFMGSKFGKGHVEMNKLAVAYSSNGEDLLQSSPSSYSPFEEHTPYDYFLESSFGNNTVVVDGYSQRRLIGSYSDFAEPESGLWHTSDNLDYAESTYSNGYNTYIGTWDERKNAKVSDVAHKRQVIMDKENRLAVICDNMISNGAHTYIQNWNFAEKFNNINMIDVQNDAILSNENVIGEGIELYSFSPSQLNYNVMCGDKTGDIYKGWYLRKYSTDYTPCIHTEIEFGGDGNTQIITLLMPKSGAETRIEAIDGIQEGKGFSATLTDGTEIICLLNCANDVSVGDITFAGDLLYMTKNTDGVINGTAIGRSELIISGIEMDSNTDSFEFVINGEPQINAITKPETFRWSSDGAEAIPVYTK